MKLIVSDKWLGTCGMMRFSGVALDVISVRDFGSQGKFYTVQLPHARWEVRDVRGVTIIEG